MISKTIVVLANSVKRSDRCLAGKEWVRSGEGWLGGNWIRPVTSTTGGAVSEYQMYQALGHAPKPLEILEIPLEGPAPLPYQPENWLLPRPIQPNSWKSIGQLPFAELGMLIDTPRGLWNDGSGWRRVKAGYPEAMTQPASLYLIRPERISSIRVWSENNPFEQQRPVKRHRVATIHYASVPHDLDIDDLEFAARYFPVFPKVSDPSIHVALSKPSETVICVSLTGPYYGHHYKIAAAFFEPPA
ncbi:MAG: hypothetical protein U1G07_21550 [Verrucomicrobiota bacterium]